MNKINKHPVLLLLFLGALSSKAKAQQNIVAAGGEASGSGGIVSYSIGQIDYVTASGTGGSATQGVQQPYEISIVTGISNTEFVLSCNVFPNPTTDQLNITFNSNEKGIKYSLMSVDGKLIQAGDLEGELTMVDLKHLATGVYYLRLNRNSTEVKTFKIVKNK